MAVHVRQRAEPIEFDLEKPVRMVEGLRDAEQAHRTQRRRIHSAHHNQRIRNWYTPRSMLSTILLVGMLTQSPAQSPRTPQPAKEASTPNPQAGKQHRQVTVSLDRPSSNVDITSYVLVTDDFEADRRDAEAIMRLRAKLPRRCRQRTRPCSTAS